MVSKALFSPASDLTQDDKVSSSDAPVASTGAASYECQCPTPGQLSFALVPGDNAPRSPHPVVLSSGCGGTETGTETGIKTEAGLKDSVAVLRPCSSVVAEQEAFLTKCTAAWLNGQRFYNYSADAANHKLGEFTASAPGFMQQNSTKGANLVLRFEFLFCPSYGAVAALEG
jgi:hypothetical protein